MPTLDASDTSSSSEVPQMEVDPADAESHQTGRTCCGELNNDGTNHTIGSESEQYPTSTENQPDIMARKCRLSSDTSGAHLNGLPNMLDDTRIERDALPADHLLAGKQQTPSHIDNGWAWLIVVGCCSMHFLVGGYSRSYGIIYVYLMERFGGSAAVTAWVGGAATALRMGGSPVSTALVQRFSTRMVVFVGGVFYGVGVILSAFTPNTEFLFFTLSFMTGIGGALVYSPSIVLVGQYFDKYRAIAMGLATAGSGLGVFCFPPLIEYLFSAYSYRGGMLIVGAILLNNSVSGVLYRPPGAPPIKHKQTADVKTAQDSVMRPVHVKSSIAQKLKIGFANSTESLEATYSPVTSKSKKPIETIQKQHPDSTDSTALKTCCKTSVHKYLDLSLLKDTTFILYSLSLCLVTTSYISGQMLVPPYALERGVSKENAMWLLSIIGITDTIARVSGGFFFSIPSINRTRRHVYNTFIMLSALTHFAWMASESFLAFAIVSAIHGLVNGVVIGQKAVICIDLMGMKNLPSSFSMTVFLQGVGLFIGPPVAGLIKDVTGTYSYSFLFTGFSAIVSAALLFLDWVLASRSRKAARNKQNKAVDSDIETQITNDTCIS